MTRPIGRPISREPWPAPRPPADPFGEPPPRDLDALYADYHGAGGHLAREAHDAAVARFDVALRRHWCQPTEATWSTVEAIAEPLLLLAPRQPEHRRFPPPVTPASEAMLVRIATDLVPAMGNAALDRVLGPWSREELSPRLRQVATAAGAFLAPDDLPYSAMRRWSGRTPVPPVAERERVRCVLQAPFTAHPILRPHPTEPWVLGAPVGGGTAHARVTVPSPALLPGTHAPLPGDTLLARVVCAPEGDIAVCPIVVPGPVPGAAEGWVDLITLHHRLGDRRASTADVLRHKGHLLAQRVLEAAWPA